MIDKEIIDNLNNEDKLLLLRTTSNSKVFYDDVIKGKINIENIRLELSIDKSFFPNRIIYDKNGKTREVPHLIKIMQFAKVGDPYKWSWINSVDRCDWDWFYATYYLLVSKHYTNKELYVMSELQTIRNYKLQLLENV